MNIVYPIHHPLDWLGLALVVYTTLVFLSIVLEVVCEGQEA